MYKNKGGHIYMTTQTIIKKYEEMSDHDIQKNFARKSKQDKKRERLNKKRKRYQDEQILLATLQAESNKVSTNNVLLQVKSPRP